jgi:hypothetical protein
MGAADLDLDRVSAAADEDAIRGEATVLLSWMASAIGFRAGRRVAPSMT